MTRFALLTSLLLTGPASGQNQQPPPPAPDAGPDTSRIAVRAEPVEVPLAIVGETAVAPYRVVRLEAKGVPAKAGVLWKVRPLDTTTDVVDWASRQNVRAVEWVAPPGRYRVELNIGSVGADGALGLDYVEVLVTIGQAPQPPPGPGPNPLPPPTPVKGPFFVVVVEETATAAAERGRLFADPAVVALFRQSGHKLRMVDKDVIGADGKPPADIKRFLDASAGKPYPQIFLVDQKGQTVATGNLPKQPADLIAFLRQWSP